MGNTIVHTYKYTKELKKIKQDKNNNYIVTSHYHWGGQSEPIKIFDFNGVKIKEINDSKDKTLFIDTYYDKINCKIYIITGNKGFIKSYDYNDNKILHIYSPIQKK